MRVNQYKVNWRYSGCNVITSKYPKLSESKGDLPVCETTCNITEITNNPEEPFKDVVHATVKKHHLDKFDKRVARKISFIRAISGFSKAERKLFWGEFLKNIKH